jgi:hypothetical protein
MAFQGYFPAVKPAASPVGLLNSDGVTVVHHSGNDESWTQGPQDVESLTCAFGVMLSDYCSNEADGVIKEASDTRVLTTYPFGIITEYTCTGQGLTMDARKERVLDMAEASTQQAVENELWTGAIALASAHLDVQYLASAAAVEVSPGGAATSPERSLAAMEWAISQSGIPGVIHMTADVASRLSQSLRNDNGKISTMLGTPIVVGSGYTGAAAPGVAPIAAVPVPAVPTIGAAPVSTWIYASGPVMVHLGDVAYIGENIDTTTNEIRVLAGRPAAVYWDGCIHFSAEVNLAS